MHFGPGQLTASHSGGFPTRKEAPAHPARPHRLLTPPEGAKVMRSKRSENKDRNLRGVSRKPATSVVKTHAVELSPWLKIFEDGETLEDEWMGELCAPKSLPISTRRKR